MNPNIIVLPRGSHERVNGGEYTRNVIGSILEFPAVVLIDPIHKGVSLFLSYTNMNTINSLHHVKEHSKISNFLQFESHSSKSFKVRAI